MGAPSLLLLAATLSAQLRPVAVPVPLAPPVWSLPSLDAAPLPSYLDVPRRDAPAVLEALELAKTTPVGRKVLRRIEERGTPVPVRLKDLKGDYGAYDYMRGTLELDRRHASKPRRAAATLIHELVHVLQHDQRLPAEALELEMEAHLASMDVSDALGDRPKKRSFEAGLRRAIRRGAAGDYMQEQLPTKHRLKGSSIEAIRRELRSDHEDLVERWERRPTGSLLLQLQRVRNDLLRLGTPKGREAYVRFARRMERRLRR